MSRYSSHKKTPPHLSNDTNGEGIDYKDLIKLKGYLSETGKIVPSRTTGISAKTQRQLTLAIKRARGLALLPYCDRHK